LADEAYSILYERESSLLAQSRRLERILRDLAGFDELWTSHGNVLTDTIFKLEDTALMMRDYQSQMDFSPERLNQVEQRLAEIDGLSRKYGNTIDEIISYGRKCEKQLEDMISHADRLDQLHRLFREAEKEYLGVAGDLSQKRQSDAGCFEKEIPQEFAALAMEKMKLSVRFQNNRGKEEIDNPSAGYGPTGIDKVEFFIAPNEGEDMKSLTRITSGGELSRIMLAIQSLCGGEKDSRTMVFDEVDSGIGGGVAESVAKRLKNLARFHQVLCVTHLPQIACYAEKHFHVSKHMAGERTETQVKSLSEKERIDEISRMLGGEVITKIARQHAIEMLRTAK